MHRLRVPSATRKQALHRQIYGHRQPGPGGKASLPLALPGKGGKKPRKEKIRLALCGKNNLLLGICRRQHLLPAANFLSLSSLASDACLNKVWKCIYQSPLAGGHLAQSPEILGSSGGHESSSEEGAMPLSLATSIRKRARAPCLVVRN